MIDPSDVTKFDRTDAELEEFLLFCIIVAGKKATTQAKKLDQFLNSIPDIARNTPFQIISEMINQGLLMDYIKASGMGQYNRLYRVFSEVLTLDLRACTTDDLEVIKGIGPKTSRYFLLHSRNNQDLAVLDRHILRWMSEKFGIKTPSNTPSTRKTYKFLEDMYVAYCKENNVSTATLDLAIWNWQSNKKLTPGVPV